jgi:hypothetical protein
MILSVRKFTLPAGNRSRSHHRLLHAAAQRYDRTPATQRQGPFLVLLQSSVCRGRLWIRIELPRKHQNLSGSSVASFTSFKCKWRSEKQIVESCKTGLFGRIETRDKEIRGRCRIVKGHYGLPTRACKTSAAAYHQEIA